MVREGASRQGAGEVVLQQVALRASSLQLGLVLWAALRKAYALEWPRGVCSIKSGC